MDKTRKSAARGEPRARGGLASLVFLGIAVFFLLTEHRAHLFGILPYLLLFLCPLMHLFMHHGHGNRHDGGDEAATHSGTPYKGEQR